MIIYYIKLAVGGFRELDFFEKNHRHIVQDFFEKNHRHIVQVHLLGFCRR